MAKMFLSLGFWMTIVLFIALGYAIGADCPDSMDCSDGHSAIASSVLQNENQYLKESMRARDVASSIECPPSSTSHSNELNFAQMANLQGGGGPVYAPGISFVMTPRSSQMIVCPGPVEIPRH